MLPNGVRCCGRGLPIEPAPPPKSGEGRRGVGWGVRLRRQKALVMAHSLTSCPPLHGTL